MTRILVPLDGSLPAEQALPTAVSLARRLQARLELMIVDQSPPGGGFEGWPWAISTPRSHGDYVESRARHASHATGTVVDHGIVEGHTAEQICRYATEKHADLIVMVSRGYSGITRVLGGSVTDAVLRRAHIPVLVLRAVGPTQRQRASALRVERIVVAIDGSAESYAALDAALSIADRGVTELHLVEVVAPVMFSALEAVRRSARVDRAATQASIDSTGERLSRLAELVAERTQCDAFPHVIVNDDPARGIVRIARSFNASVIAMGTHGRGASRLFMGSVAERVLHDARFPMLLARSTGAVSNIGDWSHAGCEDSSVRSG